MRGARLRGVDRGNRRLPLGVHRCHRLGIATGLDLDRLVSAARLAQELLGRTLPGMMMKAGPADALRDPEAAREKVD